MKTFFSIFNCVKVVTFEKDLRKKSLLLLEQTERKEDEE